MKNLSHFRTHARALLACYLDMTPEQQRLLALTFKIRPCRRCKPCVTQPVRLAGRWLICCKICNNLATTNNNAHILRIFSVKRAKVSVNFNASTQMNKFLNCFAHFYA